MSCSPPLPRGPGIARRLRQPAVLTNPASNLPHQPFPTVYRVKLAPGQAQGRRQTPARGGGRQRSDTPPISVGCRLLSPSPCAPWCCRIQAGGRLAGTCQGWLWDLGRTLAYHLLLPVLGKEKMKNWKYSLSRRIWVKQKERFQNQKFPEQVWLFSVKMPSLVLLSKAVCWRTEWILNWKPD